MIVFCFWNSAFACGAGGGALLLALALASAAAGRTYVLIVVALCAAAWVVAMRTLAARLPSPALKRVLAHYLAQTTALLLHNAVMQAVSAAHVAGRPLLPDVGFALLAPRPALHVVSDVMARLTLIALVLRALATLRPGWAEEELALSAAGDVVCASGAAPTSAVVAESRRDAAARIVEEWMRVMCTMYVCRAPMFWVTSLPGPAPHCRDARAPPDASDVWASAIHWVAPMFGATGSSCGDLVYSGHTAFATINMLFLCRHTRALRAVSASARCRCGDAAVLLCSATYVAAMGAIIVASRRHYTVDVLLGALLGYLLFCRFVGGWSARRSGGRRRAGRRAAHGARKRVGDALV